LYREVNDYRRDGIIHIMTCGRAIICGEPGCRHCRWGEKDVGSGTGVQVLSTFRVTRPPLYVRQITRPTERARKYGRVCHRREPAHRRFARPRPSSGAGTSVQAAASGSAVQPTPAGVSVRDRHSRNQCIDRHCYHASSVIQPRGILVELF